MSTQANPAGLADPARQPPDDRWPGDEVDVSEAAAEAIEPQPVPATTEPDPYTEQVYAYLREWVQTVYEDRENGEKYLANALNHFRRYVTSLHWIPAYSGRVFDPAAGDGCFPHIVRHFRRCEVEVPAYFNLEREPAPYPDETFDGVVLTEVLEHFSVDPMYALAEINRVLKPGGFLFLTTPNLASWVSIQNLMTYHTPYLYGLFEREPSADRHNREYTVTEVRDLAGAAGFEIENLDAINVYPDHDAVTPIPGLKTHWRGDTTFLLGRKRGPVIDRYPGWLYANWGG